MTWNHYLYCLHVAFISFSWTQMFSLCLLFSFLNPLSANPTKWSNTLKQFVANFPTNCLRVFDQFVGLAPKGLRSYINRLRFWSTLCKAKFLYLVKIFFHIYLPKNNRREFLMHQIYMCDQVTCPLLVFNSAMIIAAQNSTILSISFRLTF